MTVTIDPLSTAIPVADPEIVEILDLDTGEIIEAEKYISGMRYEELIANRLTIKERLPVQPIFGCSLCTTPVYIVSSPKKHFFFRHTIENGSCPAVTRHSHSRDEICALKYHGLRESRAHKRIKELIHRSLSADPGFSNIQTEKQWRSTQDKSSRRQPDVQALRNNLRVAFEAQLSTTFLDVVVGRRVFYRDENALLVWVLGEFDPNHRKLTVDDLLISNNSNVFVVDEETEQQSELEKRFLLRCFYRVPERIGREVADCWATEIVAFDQLTLDQNNQSAFYFDYAHAATLIREEIAEIDRIRFEAADDALRERFFALWLPLKHAEDLPSGTMTEWTNLCDLFDDRAIYLPDSPNSDSNFTALLNCILSAKSGRPIGWRFQNLIQVGHRIADSYPQHVAAFGFSIKEFEQEILLEMHDKSGKWKIRSAVIRQSLQSRDQDFRPDTDTLPLISFLFPKIATKLENLASKFGV
tara:strand:- start:1555 stop:2967 length:1413 start_codon:yes stop_codon:yes gene_type:complete